jgi:hypothetical protein
VARVCPSGVNALAFTGPVCPVSGSPSRRGRVGSVRSHSSTVWSELAVARVCPSGANRRDRHDDAQMCRPGDAGIVTMTAG